MTMERALLTAEDLFGLPKDGRRYELVAGRLVEMPPTSGMHGSVEAWIAYYLIAYAEEHGGEAWAGEPGFILRRGPDFVRAPDVCFFVAGRVPPEEAITHGYSTILPDLVVEVVSPGDTAAEVQQKVTEWLAAGVPLVWVAYPATRMIVAYRSLTDIRTYTEADTLEAAPVLPDFRCPVTRLFRRR